MLPEKLHYRPASESSKCSEQMFASRVFVTALNATSCTYGIQPIVDVLSPGHQSFFFGSKRFRQGFTALGPTRSGSHGPRPLLGPFGRRTEERFSCTLASRWSQKRREVFPPRSKTTISYHTLY